MNGGAWNRTDRVSGMGDHDVRRRCSLKPGESAPMCDYTRNHGRDFKIVVNQTACFSVINQIRTGRLYSDYQ